MSISLPRIELARLPTPVDHLETLSRELGVNLYVKRDDLTGAALTGNKVRKLEYLLPEALERQADVVITCGGAQSNHCRATAIAARRVGLEVELLLRGLEEASGEGNLLLNVLVGSALHSLTAEQYVRRDEMLARRAEEIQAEGLVPYVIPEGGSSPLGAMGYVRCAEEIAQDQLDAETSFDFIVTAVGSGGTLAGLLAGAELSGLKGRVVGVPVCDDANHFKQRVGTLLDGIRDTYCPELRATIADHNLKDGFVGEGYGKASDSDLERLRDVAVLTGLLLDPVYTNKAFGAVLDMIREGEIARGQSVLFLHTGGIFGLFPFQDRLLGAGR